MAFKQTRDDHVRRKQTFERNEQPENRRCTNCYYYNFEDGEHICTRDRHEGVTYRMPGPDIAQNKVCSKFYPSSYRRY